MNYCGVDIIEVERVKEAIGKTSGFRERVYTKKEIKYIESKSELVKYQHYAGRFAAKEAIYKALSEISEDIELFDIEIVNNEKNRPVVNIINDHLNSILKERNIKIDVSISHIKEYAVASSCVSCG